MNKLLYKIKLKFNILLFKIDNATFLNSIYPPIIVPKTIKSIDYIEYESLYCNPFSDYNNIKHFKRIKNKIIQIEKIINIINDNKTTILNSNNIISSLLEGFNDIKNYNFVEKYNYKRILDCKLYDSAIAFKNYMFKNILDNIKDHKKYNTYSKRINYNDLCLNYHNILIDFQDKKNDEKLHEHFKTLTELQDIHDKIVDDIHYNYNMVYEYIDKMNKILKVVKWN